jgi:DNA helicase-2/ATP-dependent DNA helicase PcrA
MPWNDNLDPNSAVYQIAASDSVRIRVLAGPGAGKSFAMKRRVARLLEADALDVEEVLAVTFTRVAAEDLHRELVSLEVANAAGLNGRTLHSLAMEILMRNHVLETLGRTPRPLNAFELDPLLEDLGAAHGTKHQRRRLTNAYVAAWSRLQHEEPGYAPTEAEQAFADDLTDWLVLHQAMLIGEVIPQLYQYLRDNPAAPELGEFRHILIDEYQDLNRVEQEALALLGAAGAMCVIGDDDQSIYSFKHAHPAGVREWADIHNAEDHEIGECRRCPTTVVRMANSLIRFNQDRLPRQMQERVENGVGQVVIRQFSTADEEAGQSQRRSHN